MPHGLGLQRSTPSIASGSSRVASGPPTSLLPVGGLQGRAQRQRTEELVLAPPLRDFGAEPVGRPTIERKTEAVTRRQREAGGMPQFEDDPIGAIAFALREVGAALQGQELPSVRARHAAQEDRALRQRGLGVKINALKFGIEECGDLKGEERTACINGLADTVGDLDPDFASTLEATIGTPKALDITKIASHPAAIDFLEGAFDSDEDRRDFAISEQGQKILQSLADKADRPVLEATLDEVFGGIAATLTPEDRAGVGVSPSMIRELDRQGKLPDRFKLTGNMLDMLDREPGLLDDRARQFGFMTSKELEAKGLAEAKARGKAAAAAPKGKAVNILLPDGGRATGRELPTGELMVVGQAGVLTAAPPGSLKMAVQAAPGELPDAILRREATQIEVTAKNFLALAQKTRDFLADPKLVLGGAGSTIVFAQGLVAQARQLGQAFADQHFDGTTGKVLSLAEILDPKRYNFEGMRAIAAATSRTRANIIAMAYIVARVRDPAGRLSDFDVQAAMDTFAFASNDKRIIAAAISDRIAEVVGNAANFIESVTGTRPTFQAVTPPPSAAPVPKTKRTMTIEELEERARQAR